MEIEMRTITFSVADEAETKRRVRAAFERKKQGHHMSFASVELMWRSPNRRQIIQIMTGEEPMTLREIARRAERAVHDVQTDLNALLVCGIIDRNKDGRFSFPYDAVHVEFHPKELTRAEQFRTKEANQNHSPPQDCSVARHGERRSEDESQRRLDCQKVH